MTDYTITITDLGDTGSVVGGSPVEIVVSDGTSAGGGGVTSVNAHTGVVVLDAEDVGAATTAQGALADTAVQPGDLAAVATSGDYTDLTGTPTLGTAAASAATDFDAAGSASAAQTAAEAYTDAAVAGLGGGAVDSVNGQTGTVVLTASDVGADASGAASSAQTAAEGYTDSAIASEVTRADAAYATATQGSTADSAVQPGDLATVATTGAYSDLIGQPTIPSTAADVGAVPTTRTVNGHALSADVTVTAADVSAVPTTRTITAGTGLTGGGDLSANRTLTVAYGTTSSTAAVGNDSRLSDARTPTAHASTHASGGTDAVALDASQVTRTTNAQTGTTYTLVLTDASKFVTLTNASGVTLTVPKNSSVAFPVGTEIILAQLGAGQVTITPVDGTVTINASPGLKVAAQYGTAALKKTATDTWLAFGRLSA